ncbi:endonuclease/exonuclease/phosphatase family metal-dependent hydrolase [Kitasatospora gansuensis]|uniref:Endonuclease/exonuclease/phosphatase family metal-dependent hydrolase n=1 Tax=Kitasatospora gansuensis TaxID=258050 RepID=A0A7W7WLS4_9ACTN|nr:jacalin-like lectin [Kitasatospora gansuensis]MBB4951074.1 endonuclease/exonuclease/phosphatase family metal-dependent hydrolase [Kitasatospora gansuensis]
MNKHRFRRSVGTCLAGVLAAAGLLGVVPAHAAPTASGGSLSVLTYNVAGLPQVLSSASTDRQTSTTAIGQRIAPYDLVHVQEDFNYHAALYAADAHPYRTATSGGAGIGSGLNTLSGSAYDGDDFERVRWNDCQLDSGDCLTPKGFTFMRVRLAEGVYLDAYNLHANAGTEDGDEKARAANLAQLTAFIKTHSAGNAVLVMGDTNTRYTRAADTIAAFAADNRLTDPWVTLEHGGVAPRPGADPLLCDPNAVTDTCEVVDKVLYRGSRLVSLTATSYANRHADFLDPAGKMLSDHDPIAVGFSWSRNPAYQASEQYGGPHGDYYTDIDRVAPGAGVSVVGLRAGSRLDQVGLTLADGTALTHGGTGGTASSLTLASGEYLDSVALCQGQYNGRTRIFSAKFTTNLGRSLAGGATTSDCVTRTAPAGWQIAGFTGRAGDNVDKLGLIYTQR